MPTTYQVVVLRRNINRLYLPRGDGYRWLDRVNKQMHDLCVATAPSRTGRLKAGHRSGIRAGSQNYVRAQVYNVAEHAEWVHDGTPRGNPGGEIRGPVRVPRKKGPLRGAQLPKRQVFYADSISGQVGNPWLERACERVALIHGGRRIG